MGNGRRSGEQGTGSGEQRAEAGSGERGAGGGEQHIAAGGPRPPSFRRRPESTGSAGGQGTAFNLPSPPPPHSPFPIPQFPYPPTQKNTSSTPNPKLRASRMASS